MEWQYDPDEEKSIVPLSDLRKKGSAPAEAAPGGDRTLGIFGPEAGQAKYVIKVPVEAG